VIRSAIALEHPTANLNPQNEGYRSKVVVEWFGWRLCGPSKPRVD
jgi:hypothetical protein